MKAKFQEAVLAFCVVTTAMVCLKEKGAKHKDIEEFNATIREVWAAGKSKDAITVQNGISKLKKMSSTFLMIFNFFLIYTFYFLLNLYKLQDYMNGRIVGK